MRENGEANSDRQGSGRWCRGKSSEAREWINCQIQCLVNSAVKPQRPGLYEGKGNQNNWKSGCSQRSVFLTPCIFWLYPSLVCPLIHSHTKSWTKHCVYNPFLPTTNMFLLKNYWKLNTIVHWLSCLIGFTKEYANPNSTKVGHWSCG